MPESFDVLLTFVLILAVSFAATYVVTRRDRTVRPSLLDLPLEGQLKVLCSGGAYRCRILAVTPCGIEVSAPLRHDRYVPLRPGEHVVGQCGVPGGLLTFHSTVLNRDPSGHTLMIAGPSAYRRSERRAEPRSCVMKGLPFTVGGAAAEIVDCSSWGLRYLTKTRPDAGELVAVDLPEGFGPVRGYVLEVRSAYYDGGQGREVRIRFEDQVRALSGRVLYAVR